MKRSVLQIRRLYWIDAALRRGEFPTTAGLARELGISRGTVYRDLQALRIRYKAPITFDPSRGGYAYGRAFRPDLPHLSAEEAIELAQGIFKRGPIPDSALAQGLMLLLRQVAHLLPNVGESPAGASGTEKAPVAASGASGWRDSARGSGAATGASAGARRPRSRVTVHLRFDQSVAREVLQSGLFRKGEVQLLTDGGVEAAVTTRDPEPLLFDLLRWAPHFEVAGPPWVRRRLPQILRRLLRQMEARKTTRRRRKKVSR